MFKFLKEKIGEWTKKISKSAETSKEEIEEKKLDQEKEIEYLEKHAKKLVEKEIEGKEIPEEIRKKEPLSEIPSLEEKSKPEKKEEKKSFLQRAKDKISKVKISEKEFGIYEEELENLFLENNVSFEVTEKMIKELKEGIVGKDLLRKEIEGEIKENFKKIIRRILVEPFDLIEKIKSHNSKEKEPYVILFSGINGTGKTTTIAKIAEYFKKNEISVVLAAADTFRAASIEQIKFHADKLGVKLISHEYGSDPAAVGFDAIQYAKKNRINCVLIDTAGRMHTEKNLMKEIEKVAKVTKPHTTIFIGESLTGNDVIEQAKSFDWAIGIDGIILTKADVDEKGGTALSVGYVTKKPILFLGTGQEYKDIEPFDKEKFIERLGL